MTSTPSSQPPGMEVVDVAAEGDVILTLQHSRLRVSSVILASASPVFKVMLGPVFLEGQDFRGAQYPKEIPLEDDSSAMTRLCFLLHHKRDPQDPTSHSISLLDDAEGLFALAVVADKYGSIDAVRMAGDSLLSYFAYNSVSTFMATQALLYFIGTAYILKDQRQFALYTRRLIMDHAMRFSLITSHPALAALPHHFLLFAEEQREDANMALRDGLLPLADRLCMFPDCTTDVGPDFLTAFFKTVGSRWPLNGYSAALRTVFKKIGSCGSVKVDHKCHRVHYEVRTVSITVTSEHIKGICNKASAIASGLCLTCVREDKFVEGPCEHHELLKQCVKNDPIF